MKRIFGGLLLVLISCAAWCQSAKSLVKEGVALHDEGKYEEAIKKYDAAIALDNSFFEAYYEKSFSLLASNKYDDCLTLCKSILKQFTLEPNLAGVYINYGTCFDLQGKPKQAVNIYDKGIAAYPRVGLLHFNKAITLYNMKKEKDAIEEIEKSIELSPYHGSSHNFLSRVTVNKNKILSLMASLVLIATEPTSARAQEHLQLVEKTLTIGAKKTGENSVSITLLRKPAQMLLKKGHSCLEHKHSSRCWLANGQKETQKYCLAVQEA